MLNSDWVEAIRGVQADWSDCHHADRQRLGCRRPRSDRPGCHRLHWGRDLAPEPEPDSVLGLGEGQVQDSDSGPGEVLEPEREPGWVLGLDSEPDAGWELEPVQERDWG